MMQRCLLLIGAVAISACSLAYNVDVLAKNGRVVFRLTTKGLGGGKAAPVVNLSVLPVLPSAKPVWEIENSDLNGREEIEIRYGVVPAGMNEKIKPTPLRPGQLYRVDLRALGGGGSQQFILVSGPGPEQPITQLMIKE